MLVETVASSPCRFQTALAQKSRCCYNSTCALCAPVAYYDAGSLSMQRRQNRANSAARVGARRLRLMGMAHYCIVSLAAHFLNGTDDAAYPAQHPVIIPGVSLSQKILPPK